MKIVFFSSIRWDFSWHRQQEIMSMLSKKGHEILFVQPCNKRKPFHTEFYKVQENVWILTPLGLPYERCLHSVNFVNGILARYAICRAMKELSFENPIVWFDRVHGIDNSFFLKYNVVYDLIDEILAFGKVRNKKMLIDIENRVLRNADLLISSSRTLLERKIEQSGRVGENIFIPNGVDTNRFSVLKIKNQQPVIGFVGDISRRSINSELVRECAQEHPEWKFYFVGPCMKEFREDLCKGLYNVEVHHQVPGEDVPNVISSFDVGIIPYRHEQDDMDYVFPRKACEYLAAGKPVVSTNLKEIRYLEPMVFIADDAAKFGNAIEGALKLDENYSSERRKFALQFDWDILLAELIRTLERLIKE